MPFSAEPMPEVEEFIKKHYKGGSVIDFGCGAGRYAHCFDSYTGIDGHEGNIKLAQANYPDKTFILADLETFFPHEKYDNLFSSVVFDQVANLPKGWAKKYILIEPTKYESEFKILVKEPLQNISMMVAEDK